MVTAAMILWLKRRNGNSGRNAVENGGTLYHQQRLILDELRELSRGLGDYHHAVTRAERDRLDMHELVIGKIGDLDTSLKIHALSRVCHWTEQKAG